MFRIFLLCTDFGSKSVATYGFEKRTHAENLTSPTLNSDRKIREFRPHYIGGHAQSHSRVEREKVSWYHYISDYIQKYSAYKHQWRTSDSTPTEYLRLLKSVRTIKASLFTKQTDKLKLGKTIHQIQRGELFFSFLKKESKFSHKKKIQSIFFLRSEG